MYFAKTGWICFQHFVDKLCDRTDWRMDRRRGYNPDEQFKFKMQWQWNNNRLIGWIALQNDDGYRRWTRSSINELTPETSWSYY